MFDIENPKLHILMKPLFDGAHQAISLEIVLTIQSLELSEGSTIVSFPPTIKPTNFKDGINVSDEKGKLPTACKDLDGAAGLSWLARCQTIGDVKLEYSVAPSSDKTSLSLCCDHGGLLGSGLEFIPTPSHSKIYRNIVEWDLSEAPEGTRAVWTFGEGPAAVERVGPASAPSDSVYMVGPIHSIPPTPIPGSISDYYGYYWLGSLPQNLEVIKDMHHDFFLKICVFFEETPSASDPYRSFVRSTGSRKSFISTNLLGAISSTTILASPKQKTTT